MARCLSMRSQPKLLEVKALEIFLDKEAHETRMQTSPDIRTLVKHTGAYSSVVALFAIWSVALCKLNLKADTEDTEPKGSESYPKVLRICHPLTVKQVLQASRLHEDSPFTYNGHELLFVRCVGHIMFAEAREKHCKFTIEDSSAGRLQIFLFSQKRQEKDPPDNFFEQFVDLMNKGVISTNKYIRVLGEISGSKEYGNSIKAKNIFPVKDPHEIFFHVLECMALKKHWEETKAKQEAKEREKSSTHEAAISTDRKFVEGEGKDKATDSPMLTPPDYSDSDELEYASEDELDGPEDSSDEEASEMNKADEVDSKDNLNCADRVNLSATHDQLVTLENSDNKISVQEVDNVQVSMQALSLAPNDTVNAQCNLPTSVEPASAISSNTELHSQTSEPELDPLSGLSNAARALFLHIVRRRDEIEAAGEEEWIGLNVSELARFLNRQKKGMSPQEISNTLSELTVGDYMFETIDESHYDVYDV